MAQKSQSSSIVATRYVGALIDLAQAAKALDAVEKDLKDLAATLNASADLQSLIRSPLIPITKQLTVIDAIAKKAKLSELSVNFLKTLTANRRLNILGDVFVAFQREVSKRRGEVLVEVSTAQDLSATQVKDLTAALKKGIGADVAVSAKVDPSILGGMVVTVGSYMIDDSVARKLDRLKTTLGSSANENAAAALTQAS